MVAFSIHWSLQMPTGNERECSMCTTRKGKALPNNPFTKWTTSSSCRLISDRHSDFKVTLSSSETIAWSVLVVLCSCSTRYGFVAVTPAYATSIGNLQLTICIRWVAVHLPRLFWLKAVHVRRLAASSQRLTIIPRAHRLELGVVWSSRLAVV